ncbi:OmpH family outer membrane protein [bacterium]|nr:OmpH family outer membrane protein [bacterium]
MKRTEIKKEGNEGTFKSVSQVNRRSVFLSFFLFMFLCSISILTTSAFAEYKLATVDINKVLNETKESKEARQSLTEESTRARATIEKKRQALQDKEAALKARGVSPDSKEAEEFRQEAKDFGRLVKDTEEELKRKFLRSNTEITQKTLQVIEAYAKSNKIDLILEKGQEGKGAVLFGAPSVDITKEVIEKLKG